MEQRSREQGFTLVELMIVVAIIAILAVVVVPQFTKESRKSKATSEVGAMVGELGIREEQYKTENNAYLEAAACPTSPGRAAQDTTTCLATSSPWDALRVHPPSAKLYCSYEVTTSTSSSTTPPAWVTAAMFTAPATSWYFVVATCDLDGDGIQSQYFQSSVSAKLEKHNDGE